MIKHVALRKAILAILFVVIFGSITVFSILQKWTWSIILGTAIIGLVLFFNISRRIYPVREILRQSTQEEQPEKEEPDPDSPGDK